MRRILLFALVSVLGLAVSCTPTPPVPLVPPAEEVRVAAASDLEFAIKEIIPAFENSTGNKVGLTLGSSGNFFAQISNGAPFDVFLSADISYPKRLEAEGHAEKGTTTIYGVGRIVLWVPKASPIDVEKLGMDALLHASAKKIAIANPEHAPYGRAAVAAMEKTNVYAKVQPKIVRGENIAQTAQFVQSGAADIGIIALALASSDVMKNAGRYWLVPDDAHPRLEQAAVLVKGTAGARAFLSYLESTEAKAVFKRYGFQ